MNYSFGRRFPPPPKSFLGTPPNPTIHSAHFAVVGSDRYGINGPYQGVPSLYFPIFEAELAKHGVRTFYYASPEKFSDAVETHQGHPLIVLPLYNLNFPGTLQIGETVEAICRNLPGCSLANRPKIAVLLHDKNKTNEFYAKAGIDVPRRLEKADVAVFSNTTTGSHTKVEVLAPGEQIDAQRYNTEMIDTVREYHGQRYYIALRAMAAGSRLLTAYVRARPVTSGDASVHNGDTPLDPEMIKHFHLALVSERWAELELLCQRTGDALGLGLFSHDILPSNDGRLAICESGLKYDDYSFRQHLHPISPDIPELAGVFGVHYAALGARALVQQAWPHHAIAAK